MKILAVHSAILPNPDRQSQVDHWRIYRPMLELARNLPDWTIDHSPTFIPEFAKYKSKAEFTKEEMHDAFMKLSEYNIIFASYHPDPTAWTLLMSLRARMGTEFVMDVDDDMFAINPDNPFWMKSDHEKVYWMQRMIANNPWVTTPSEILAQRFRDRRTTSLVDEGLMIPADTVTTIPNFISTRVYKHKGSVDNGDKIVIGYMGGASHYADLHETGVLEAVQKIMHENKSVHFHCIGQLVDTYLPRGRLVRDDGMRGDKFYSEVYPSLDFDIALGPLNQNIFNEGKSNIKWQEMTLAGAVFVASDIGPYKPLKHNENAVLVWQNTTEEWYKQLKRVVDSATLRKKILANAQKDVMLNWTLENEKNWSQYKTLFERIIKGENTSADHRTVPGLSAGKTKQKRHQSRILSA